MTTPQQFLTELARDLTQDRSKGALHQEDIIKGYARLLELREDAIRQELIDRVASAGFVYEVMNAPTNGAAKQWIRAQLTATSNQKQSKCICGYDPISGLRMDVACPVHDVSNQEQPSSDDILQHGAGMEAWENP